MGNMIVWGLFFVVAINGVWSEIKLDQSPSQVKRPGETVKMSCIISGYSMTSNYIHWIRQRPGEALEWIGRISPYRNTPSYASSFQSRFSFTQDVPSSTQYLEVQSLTAADSAVYFCARETGGDAFDYWGKGTMVTVTSATPTAPTVFPLMQCDSGTGDMVTLGCLATGFTPSSVTYAWNKVNGAALTDFIQYPAVQKGNVYSGVSQIRVRRQDWDAMETFKCAVAHASGQPQECIFRKPIPRPVPCYPPTLSVLASSDEGDEASFSCFAKDFSPKEYEIKWLKNEEERFSKIEEIHTHFEGRKDNDGATRYSAASFLTMKSNELDLNTQVTCEFKGKHSKCTTLMNSTVIYQPNISPAREACLEADMEVDIIGPTMEDMFSREGKGNITCRVKVNKGSVNDISWETHNGRTILHPSVASLKGKKEFSTSIPITYDEWSQGTKFVCKVLHDNWIEPLKKTYGKPIGGKIQRPSVFMLPPLEHTKKNMVTLTCYVKDFFPREVFVSWLVDDEEAGSEFEFHTTNPVENHGSYSAYGQLTLTLEQWQNSEMVYSCVVHHESVVNTSKAIVRSIGQRTCEKTNLVNLNLNIPETCKA